VTGLVLALMHSVYSKDSPSRIVPVASRRVGSTDKLSSQAGLRIGGEDNVLVTGHGVVGGDVVIALRPALSLPADKQPSGKFVLLSLSRLVNVINKLFLAIHCSFWIYDYLLLVYELASFTFLCKS
jgi:hypothetical protein